MARSVRIGSWRIVIGALFAFEPFRRRLYVRGPIGPLRSWYADVTLRSGRVWFLIEALPE